MKTFRQFLFEVESLQDKLYPTKKRPEKTRADANHQKPCKDKKFRRNCDEEPQTIQDRLNSLRKSPDSRA